jgi:arylsulfatase A-like enzyme
LRVSTPVSLVDVMPTCLLLLGHAPPAGLDGLDVSGAWRRDARPLLEGRILFGDADHTRGDRTRSARRGRYKLILQRTAGSTRLYDLEDDPGERIDLSAERADLVVELQAQIERYDRLRREGDVLPPLDPEEAEHLRELGYF